MFRSILVPIDIGHPSSWIDALPRARELAGNGAITIVTVVPDLAQAFESIESSINMERVVAGARTKLAEIAGSAGNTAAPARQVVRSGSIPHEIIQAAKAAKADLIVMASGRPEAKADYPLGSNAAQVVRHAPCSVLILRG